MGRDPWSRPGTIHVGLLLRGRAEGRWLRNKDQVANALQASFAHVEGMSFNGRMTLEQQVKFINDQDILISIHGGQLSTVSFMPKCGALLEIFAWPYWIPGFFTSLAHDAGLIASWMYASGDSDAIADRYRLTPGWQLAHRTPGDLCLPPNDIVAAVQVLQRLRLECISGNYGTSMIRTR